MMKFNSKIIKPSAFLSVAFSLFLLAGCSTLDISDTRPTHSAYLPKTDPLWLQHLDQLKQIRNYSNQGQLGYISDKKRFSARFNWQYQDAQSYTLLLSSTLTASSLKLQMTPQGLIISDHKGNQRTSEDAGLLLKEIVGMDVPLHKLSAWLKGQPEDNIDYNIGANHLLANMSYSIEDQLWTADYLNYQSVQHLALPKDILLKNQKQTLKIRVDNWKY